MLINRHTEQFPLSTQRPRGLQGVNYDRATFYSPHPSPPPVAFSDRVSVKLQTFRRRDSKACSQFPGQIVQRKLEPGHLAFEHRDTGKDEMLIARVPNGAGVVKVEQVHNKKTAGQDPCLGEPDYKPALPTVRKC